MLAASRAGEQVWSVPVEPSGTGTSASSTARPNWWKEQARELDQDFPRNNKGVGNRTFSRVKIAKGNASTYHAREWWDALKRSNWYQGMVCKIGFNPVGVLNRGHAVAVWQREAGDSNDTYYLMEPNLGVFSHGLAGLKSALEKLFYKGGGDIPRHDFYNGELKVSMSYVMFVLDQPVINTTPADQPPPEARLQLPQAADDHDHDDGGEVLLQLRRGNPRPPGSAAAAGPNSPPERPVATPSGLEVRPRQGV